MDSPLEAAVARVGDRWSLLLVEALLPGPRRFSELQEAVPAIAPNVLSSRLKHLEREGVVLARPYSERPVRLTYELTGSGRELAGALRLLSSWGAAHGGETTQHASCGTPMDVRWYCPTCDRTVADDEDADLRYV